MSAFNLPPNARCVLCGAILSGVVCSDQHRRVFCARHRAEGRHCRFCDRFFLLAGGTGEACDACGPTRVFEVPVARDACDAACRWFTANGLRLPGRIPVRLSAAMPSSSYGSGPRMLGYTEQRAELSWPFGRPPPTMVLLVGMPLMVLRMVAAHELGHVSLAEERLRLPRWAEEGSCDWLAHCYLGTIASPEAALQRRRIETRDDPVYGAGFRWVAARLAGRAPRELVPLLRAARLPNNAPRP
jgi:hypothetical protein